MPLLNNTNSVILSNGLKVIYHIDHCNPIISLQLHIKVGSIFEGSKEKGYSHFLEHLSFKSQGTYPSISDEVPCLGGIINAYTDFDSTCYYLMLPSEHMQRGLEILAELSCKTGFSDQDVETEKDIIIEEIKQYENEPEVDYIDYIQNHSFNNNPLKYPVLGTLDSIKNASFKSLSKFREKYYVPQNSFLTISGDLDEGTLPMNCAASFGIWKGNKPDPLPLMEKYLEPEPMQFSILTRVKQSTSGMLAVTLPELTERHQDSNLLHCAIRAWAIGKTSRLYKILVENEKLCSSVKVSSISGLLSGVSLILIYPDATHRVDRILKIVSEEYKRLLTSGLQCDEFEMVKKDIINSWRNSFESMEAHASALAVEELVYDYSRLYSYESEIGRISQADILPAIRKYWSPESVKIFIQYRSKPVNEISVCSSDFFGYSDYQPTDQKPRVTSVVRIQKYTLQDYPAFIAVNPNIFTGRLSNDLYLPYRRVP
ncbi:MAG: pitrilysin family protein, partial [Candidatus Cloacimonetes bacterium]|nr:pitrilysin family protein [Candidatus Cloacimonadota bacterium]